jgi:hypothetical protein
MKILEIRCVKYFTADRADGFYAWGHRRNVASGNERCGVLTRPSAHLDLHPFTARDALSPSVASVPRWDFFISGRLVLE